MAQRTQEDRRGRDEFLKDAVTADGTGVGWIAQYGPTNIVGILNLSHVFTSKLERNKENHLPSRD